MIRRFSFHNGTIIISFLSIIVATTYSVIIPQAGRRSPTKFVFPSEISLPGWNLIASHSNEPEILTTNEVGKLMRSGKKYKFRHQNRNLDIDVYYLINTRGNIEFLLKNHFNIDEQILNKIQIKQTNQNYYSIFTSQDRTYLSACLNPFGYSTFTQKQFSRNLNSRSLSLRLVGNWLLGKDSIRDRRCLWTVMSLSNQNQNPQDLSKTLERTWKDYHKWWQNRFPEL